MLVHTGLIVVSVLNQFQGYFTVAPSTLHAFLVKNLFLTLKFRHYKAILNFLSISDEHLL